MKVRSVGVAALKGTRHEALDSVVVEPDGVRGDRLFALVDPERRRVLRTVEHPELIAIRALAWQRTSDGAREAPACCRRRRGSAPLR